METERFCPDGHQLPSTDLASARESPAAYARSVRRRHLSDDTDMTRGLRRMPKPHVRLLGRGIPRFLRALQRHELIHQQESLPAAQVLIQRVGSRAFPFHN